MQNVEFKAELRDPHLARSIARAIGARHVVTLRQRDTYYRVPTGRLKRREAFVAGDDGGTPEPVELIRYERDHRPRARMSRFTIYTEDEFRERYGEAALPTWVVVDKTRDVLMHGNTRVHLDEVDGLGHFIEFEALVTPKNNLARAHQSVELLRARFAPAMGEPIGVGYAELLSGDAAAGAADGGRAPS